MMYSLSVPIYSAIKYMTLLIMDISPRSLSPADIHSDYQEELQKFRKRESGGL